MNTSTKKKREGRIVYVDPSSNPKDSLHWKRIHNNGASKLLLMLNDHEELLQHFQRDVDIMTKSGNNKENYQTIALWSCIVGYCEALTTHKDATRRYNIFPIPLDSIQRLVNDEFIPIINQAQDTVKNTKSTTTSDKEESIHRQTIRAVSNAIWKKAQNKNSNMQDELHANTVYTCLCGDVDKKSIDCFGAALLSVVGMNILGFNSSLTLSEDHAYETHVDSTDSTDGIPSQRSTSEVAIPGNTKAAQSKRGKDIFSSFEELKCDNITPETSWLYMHGNAVICDTPHMALAALIGNLNCDIDKQKVGGDGTKPHIVSKPLYKIKRDMLWILHEYMSTFPFALMELAEAEEHLSSERGMELIDATELLKSKGTTEILRNEELFLQAIHISQTRYKDKQVYPYLYAAHYHRDAGRDDQDEEYRLVESLRLYYEAARVASTYRYDTKDCIQLMKHFTTVSSLIVKDILLLQCDEGTTKAPRQWHKEDNLVAAATWLIGLLDSLLLWEENEHKQFVEVLNMQHKHSFSKLCNLLPMKARAEAITKIHSQEEQSSVALAITEEELLYFRSPRSKRLASGSLLLLALGKEKVVTRELEMALPSVDNEGTRSRRKRART